MQGHIFEKFWKKSIFPIFLQLYLVFVILYQKYYSVFSCKTFSVLTQVKLRLLWLLWSLLGLSCLIGRLEMAYDICKKSISEMYGVFNLTKVFRTQSGFYFLDITHNMITCLLYFCLDKEIPIFVGFFVQISCTCCLSSFFVRALLSEFCFPVLVSEYFCSTTNQNHQYLENDYILAVIKTLSYFMDKVILPLLNCVKKCNQNGLTQIPPVLYKDLSEGKLKTLNEYKVQWTYIQI